MRGCYRQGKKKILFSLIPRGNSCPRNVGLGEDKVHNIGCSELQLGAADKPEPGGASAVRGLGVAEAAADCACCSAETQGLALQIKCGDKVRVQPFAPPTSTWRRPGRVSTTHRARGLPSEQLSR